MIMVPWGILITLLSRQMPGESCIPQFLRSGCCLMDSSSFSIQLFRSRKTSVFPARLAKSEFHKTRLPIAYRFILPWFVASVLSSGYVHAWTDAADQKWGTLKGQIRFAGELPMAETLEITRDEEVCGNLGLVDESLVVNPGNRGIRYVAVWLDSRQPMAVHPDLISEPKSPPKIDNVGCLFTPRMLAVRVGQPVNFSNSDPVAHNAAVFARRNQPFSEVIPQSAPLQKSFLKAETQPIRVDCSIHAWMKAWLVVLDHPYVAITDADGKFEIQDIPAGEWTFKFWHERSGFLHSLQNTSGPLALQKGAIVLNVIEGEELDLGELSANEIQFQRK